MKKSKFNLTHLHSTTLDPGYLVPFLLMPTLPNDSFRIGLSTFIRAQPMLAPLMHEVRLYTQYWFVPNRIIWDEWEDFITGGNDLSLTPPFPYVTSTQDDATAGSLWDYFGFPLVEGVQVSALPFRAYQEIWNTRYRDEDLQSEEPIDYGSNEDTTTHRHIKSPSFSKDYFTIARPFTQRGGDVAVPVFTGQGGSGVSRGNRVSFRLLLAYDSTYGGGIVTGTTLSCSTDFTYASINQAVQNWLSSKTTNELTALASDVLPPYSSGSEAARFLITDDLMNKHLVMTMSKSVYQTSGSSPQQWDILFRVYCFIESVASFESNTAITPTFTSPLAGSITCPASCYRSNSQVITVFPNLTTSNSTHSVLFPNLSTGSAGQYQLDWNAAMSPSGSFEFGESVASTSGFYVRDLRQSAALQRYAERSLRYGNRYEEFIQREFGIKPRDYRIQRPEYLGGGRGVLNISEVLQTAESTDTGVGTMRGHGVASISQRPIRFRCPEHGIILGLLSIRPKSVYTQGIDREWLKRSRLDFFTPELASIGMQEVLQQELFATADNVSEVFGYSERYQEYRYQKPLVTGEFRTNLNFWNMARIFANSPNLNDEFINMEHSVSDFKRPFQIQDNSAHSFVCMLKNHIRAYRPIPKRAKDVLR